MQLNFFKRLLERPEPAGSSFEYTVRESRRTRSVYLRVSVSKGLEIVVPRGAGRAFIPDLLNRRSEWIKSAIRKMEEHRRLQSTKLPWQFPSEVEFPAVGRKWRVEFDDSKAKRPLLVEEKPGLLRLSGCGMHQKTGKLLLHKWLVREGRKHLVPWLEELSEAKAKPFGKASIRMQRTRLGSCSSRRTISLNARLLMLSRKQAEYIMLHELCHTSELNHSKRFWTLVAQACPEYEAIEAGLNEACKAMPSWTRD